MASASYGDQFPGIEMPEKLQGLCEVFDGLNIETVKNSNDQLMLGLTSNMRFLKCYDRDRARILFHRASMQGNAEAQYHLCQWHSKNLDGANVIAWCYLSSIFGSEKGKQAFDFYKNQVLEPANTKGIEKGKAVAKEIYSNKQRNTDSGAIAPTPVR